LLNDNSATSIHVLTEPLSRETFAEFGDVIEAAGTPSLLINGGACERFDDRARLTVDTGARLGISVFKSRTYALPVTIDLLERHPLASQSFIPMNAEPFLVVVASDVGGVPTAPRAFVAHRGQGVNLIAGVWHGVLTPLGADGLFAVVDRIGAGDNCDVFRLTQPLVVEANT
jgi:ureidoglycolate lyase